MNIRRTDFGGFGDVAKAFNEKGPYHSPWVFERIREHMLVSFRDPEFARVVDLGCGTGNFTRELIRKGYGIVIGLDPDPRMIQVANDASGNRYSTLERSPRYQVAFPQEISQHAGGASRCDLITCQWAFDNFCDDERSVYAIKSALRPRGIFASLTWPSSKLSRARSTVINKFSERRPRKRRGSEYTRGDRSYAPLLISYGFGDVTTHIIPTLIPYTVEEARKYMRRSGRLSTVPKRKLTECLSALDALCFELQESNGKIYRDITVILDIARL